MKTAKSGYNPIPFDPKAYADKRSKTDKAFREAYDALADEFETLAALLQARKDANLSQQGVADRMGVKQPSIARLESSLGSRKHSPSLATLRRYAEACGKRLVIRMEPAQSKPANTRKRTSEHHAAS